jgi:hypothetical protein
VQDPESAALRTIYNALTGLEPEARARVLAWIIDRFLYGPPDAQSGGRVATDDPSTAGRLFNRR